MKLLAQCGIGFALFTTLSTGFSQIVTFAGNDPGASSSSPRPQSDAAAAAFDSSSQLLGPRQVVTFEGAPFGQFNSLLVAPGVIASQTNRDATLGGIVTEGYATPTGAPTGYNTTPGGAKFIGFVPAFNVGTAYLDFTFSTPIQAWGAYVVGLETNVAGSVAVQFDDGTSHSFALEDMAEAGVQFFGFINPNRSITRVSLIESGIFQTRDIYGLDDMRYVPVPEPSVLMLSIAATGFVLLWRKFKR